MRVTILMLGSRGDVQPFLAFGLGAPRRPTRRAGAHPAFGVPEGSTGA
jgi:hypothetical protein